MAFAFAGQWGPEPVVDRFGNAVYSATFRVLLPSGGEATVYTDRTKTTTTSQPLDVDGEGNATFYAAPGRYTIELSAGGVVTSFPVGVVPDAADVLDPATADAAYRSAFIVDEATEARLVGQLAAAAAAASGIVVVPAGTEITLESQLVISSNVTLHLEEGSVLWRNWTSTSTEKRTNATIRCENAAPFNDYINFDAGNPTNPSRGTPYLPAIFDENIAITGRGAIKLTAAARTFAVGNPAARMAQLYFAGCHKFRWEDVEIGAPAYEWTCTIHGDDVRVIKPRITGGTVAGGGPTGGDSISVLGGLRGRIELPDCEGGEIGVVLGEHLDIEVGEWVVVAPHVESTKGFAVVMWRYRTGSTSTFDPFTQPVRNVHVVALTGNTGKTRNGIIEVIEDAASPGTLYGIDIDGFDVTQGKAADHDGINPHAIYLLGGQGRIRGRVRNPLQTAVWVDRGEWDVDVHCDVSQTTNAVAVEIANAKHITLRGKLTPAPTAGRAVRVTNTPRVSAVGLEINKVKDGQSGIEMVTAGNKLESDGLRILKDTGATTARGVQTNAAVDVNLRGYDTDVANPVYTPGNARSIVMPGSVVPVTRTVAFGAVSIAGGNVLLALCEGGVSDTLSTINGGFVGQELEVRNGEAAPGTAILTIATGGNVGVAANRTLDTAGKAVRLRWNGTTWAEVSNLT